MVSSNLTHFTMKTPQNVLKMTTVSPDTSRDGNSLFFSSARRQYYVSGKGITQASLEMPLQLCPEWTWGN